MKKIFLLLAVLICHYSHAQSYIQSINEHRENYKKEFLASRSSPVKADDIKYLQFFPPDETYRVEAQFTRTENAIPFTITTFNGEKRQYIKYGTLHFSLKGKPYVLHVYQSLELIKDPQYVDYLFIPFKDLTSGVESYGGGRYMDYMVSDIHSNHLTIDFNKAYNPYCAYSQGYSCPIPPDENYLQVKIEAGEKNFAKEH